MKFVGLVDGDGKVLGKVGMASERRGWADAMVRAREVLGRVVGSAEGGVGGGRGSGEVCGNVELIPRFSPKAFGFANK